MFHPFKSEAIFSIHSTIRLIFLLLLLCFVQKAQAQVLDTFPTEGKASEVIIQANKQTGLGMHRLRAVEGMVIFEGKKSEVVDMEHITANTAANNPRQAFAKIAGLNIWESDGAGLQLGIGGRGLSPNRTSNFNTRQNGYDMSADALGYPESYYSPPMEALQRIEVVRGAASLQYGTQFGGMLNFVIRQPGGDRALSYRGRQSVGSYGFLSSFNSIGGSLNKGKVGYYAFYQRKQGDGWRPNSGFTNDNAYADVHLQVTERLMLDFEYTHMQYQAQQAGGLTDVQFEQDARASYRARNWFRVNWNLALMGLEYKINDRTRISSRTFGLKAGRQSLGNLTPVNNIDFGGKRDLIDGQFRNIGNETRFLHRYGINTLVLGARFFRGKTTAKQGSANAASTPDFFFLNPDNIEKSDYTFPNKNIALFAENIFHIHRKLSLTPGIRFEHIRTSAAGYYNQQVFDFAGNLVSENQQTERSMRARHFVLVGLGASFKPSEKVELYANLSQNYRAINFTDLRIENPNNRVDPNIKDERGFTADLGLRTRQNQWFYADVTAFYVAYKDRIGLQLKADLPPLYQDYRYRTNISDARTLGIEAFAEANIWHFVAPRDTQQRITLFVNTSLIDARYINTEDLQIQNKQVELVPPFTLRTGIGYKRGAFSASASWAFTAQHYTDATNAERTASAVNGLIPAYAVADISTSYAYRFLNFEVSCNNLFDARYFTRRADAYPGPGIISADGRGLFATVEMRF